VIGDKRFWDLDASLFPKGNIWYVPNAGKNIYNNYDPAKAKELLKKARYDGRPIIMLNESDMADNVSTVLALKEQLAKVGITVEPHLYDRATVIKQRGTKDGWNIMSSLFLMTPDPQAFGAWMGTNKWIGFWDDEQSRKMDEIFQRMGKEIDYNKRYKIVEEWNRAFYEYAPYILVDYFSELHLGHKSLKGYQPLPYFFFFNCWIEK